MGKLLFTKAVAQRVIVDALPRAGIDSKYHLRCMRAVWRGFVVADARARFLVFAVGLATHAHVRVSVCGMAAARMKLQGDDASDMAIRTGSDMGNSSDGEFCCDYKESDDGDDDEDMTRIQVAMAIEMVTRTATTAMRMADERQRRRTAITIECCC